MQHKILMRYSYILLAISLVAIIVRQIIFLIHGGWVDEYETVVAAKMLAAGYKLYSEVFNQHGPLVFLSGFILEKIRNCGVVEHRIFMLLLQWCALWSLYASPLLEKKGTRIVYLIFASLMVVTYVNNSFGSLYLYQAMAGIFVVILLVQYVFPAIAKNDVIGTKEIIIGNILIASLPFLAITYLPTSILMFFAALRPRYYKQAIEWLFCGLLMNVVILAYLGTFSGYIAYHIYLNSVVLPFFGGPSFRMSINNILYALHNNIHNKVVSVIFVIDIILAGVILIRRSFLSSSWRVIFVILAVISFLSRGHGFHALPYYYACCLAFPIIFFAEIKLINRSTVFFWISIIMCVVALKAVFVGRYGGYTQKSTEFSQLTALITDPNDKIIAYSFENINYILANRLPASGNFFLLPWQVKYNEHPILGVKIDSCADIRHNKPKVMLIDKWNVYDKYSWESYGTCVQKIMDSDYVKIVDKPFYIRKDIFAKEKEKLFVHGFIVEDGKKATKKYRK